ncbi:uncharacterized protein [Oryza sativa Japonica Group]|uniref:uncharacterized protein n=1 Tax=Oryza sativa subsp. japonica TaxID=39947 RepID=UPI000005E6FE|nr:uncharacterized protein LOC107276807 [Oryza sativa Japonica Group]XP_015647099.1 uncharacterized protein LOC107276807 [Oryza sativa Japonica Group]XP_015647100.1 uncharacterized protein LOC107276807 [Oryza sativa Japonica Group]XP_015647101.1 uncharacterized protein LOC107276807 [Oryza sativa Japonica Group]
MATVGSCSGHEEEDVLLDGHAYIGNKPNHTTAVDFTRNFERLVASFWRAPPPLPSTLYVYSPDISDPAAFSEAPRIIRMVRGFILFRVVIRSRHRFCIPMEDFDYFVYNVHGRALYRITNPAPLSFHDDVVGLLPRPFRTSARCSVAALVPTPNPSVFALHVFHSDIGRWASTQVVLKDPQQDFPIKIPRNARRLLSHYPSTVITIGGEGGTMGWVDLWRGILLCDILSPDPVLRGVPLPLPRVLFKPDGLSIWMSVAHGFLMKMKVAGPPSGLIAGVSSNFKMSNSFDDWKNDCMPVHADIIILKEQMRMQLLEYKLLRKKPSQDSKSVSTNADWKLENLWVSQPTPSMLPPNIVYLIARAEFMHPKAYVLAVDMIKREVHGVTEFGTMRELAPDIICIPGSVSPA